MFVIKYRTRAGMYTWVTCDLLDALAMQRALKMLNMPFKVFHQNQECELFNTKEPYGR